MRPPLLRITLVAASIVWVGLWARVAKADDASIPDDAGAAADATNAVADTGADGADGAGSSAAASSASASSSASPAGGDAGLPVACDGGLCGTETGPTCSVSSVGAAGLRSSGASSYALALVGMAVGTMRARRLRRRNGGTPCRSTVGLAR